VEILVWNTSTKRISNLVPFIKISKSGGSGHSGGILDTLIILNPSEKTSLCWK
jgi:hypothetical protein